MSGASGSGVTRTSRLSSHVPLPSSTAYSLGSSEKPSGALVSRTV